MYRHFLITRFNLNYSKNNALSVPSEEWLSKRIKIFKRFCLPSILNQTNKNFIWLLYFDANTPDKYKQEIAQLEKENAFIKAVYIENAGMLISSLNKEIKERLAPGTEYVITTRMDNDDGLHKDATDVIQRQFKEQEFAVVNLNDGLVLGISEGKYKLASIYYISNPFVSLIEKIGEGKELKTILCKDHVLWVVENKEAMINVNRKYMWLQTIHAGNWLNQFAGKPYKNMGILKDFGIGDKEIKYPISAYIADSVRFQVKRAGRGFKKLFGKK